jgi:replicative DNA helicase
MKATPDPFDRLPVHSVDAEQGVLSCILQAPQACLVEAANRLHSDVNAFYDLRHRIVFGAFLDMQNRGQAIDTITLRQSLADAQDLEKIGGDAYIAHLADKVPSPTLLESYLDILFDKWVLRRMVATCTQAVSDIYAHEGEVTGLIARVQNDILTLPAAYDGGPRPIAAFTEQLGARIDSYLRGQGVLTGLATGFQYWDRFFSGMHPKETIILGGDPGSGKTSLAMNVAERVAVDGGHPVGILSLEMSAEDLILRLMCSRTRVNFHRLRTGFATPADVDIIRDALAVVVDPNQCPIYIDDSSGLTMYEIRSRLRAMKHRYGIRLAVVDYLQLVALTREQMFLGMASGYADVARGLQQAAKELDIPIIILSQLSNEGRKRGRKEKPKLTDFRETGAIGDVANFAGILWRPPLEDDEAETAQAAAISADPMGCHELQVKMEVVKNKNGPSNTSLSFRFLRWCMRFEDLQNPNSTVAPSAPLTQQDLQDADA